MSIFFLKNILSNAENEHAAIIKILQARGFLIEFHDGKYYLSDNATVDDAKYLSFGLTSYNIGYVIDNEEYIERYRRNWNKDAISFSYSYRGVQPLKVEIVISNVASIDSAIRFFSNKGRISGECTNYTHSWAQYAVELLGPKADVRNLEPYVAYYVKAISACGVYTWSSCDGNHFKEGGGIFAKAEYPSCIWHQYVWKYIIRPRFGDIPYIGKGIKLTEKNKSSIYNTVYGIADFLYNYRREIRSLKQKTLERINSKYINKHSSEEIESFYIDECTRIMQTDFEYIFQKQGEKNGRL